MLNIPDKHIIDFRDTVNKYNFVYYKYSDINGKNLFNPICSCMDWISVAIRSIDNAPKISNNIDVKVMQIFSLISSIDIVVESITTLHTIINNSQRRISPFHGKKGIFKNNKLRDDDEYFTQIRARFGAHPVNLQNGNERQYASWPYEPRNQDHDLAVNLYSNIVGQPDIVFGLKLTELEGYLKSRINHLKNLDDSLKIQYEEFKLKCINTPIDIEEEPEEQLIILKNEAKKRLNDDFFVDTLLNIFEVSLVEPELQNLENQFKVKLREYIDEIRNSLQNMDFDSNLVSHELLDTRNIYKIRSYELPKLFNWLSGNSDPLAGFYFQQFNDIDNSPISFNINEDTKITTLKIFLLDFYLTTNKKLIN